MACLDTNVIIDFLNGDERIREIVNRYAAEWPISTTAVNEFELLKYGKDRDRVNYVLSRFTVYPFDRASADSSALLFLKLRALGKMINENDILIAGIAAANSEILVTRDGGFKNVGSKDIVIV
ncbi:MAG: type II toxin-antitoxin system VapC family toxin [Candidatus Micrarchaeaceae archaeon]